MRALTLTQPWCGLVASGIKLVENRPRSMIKREDFGRPFAIHASREIDESVYQRVREIAPELYESLVPPSDGLLWKLSRITSAVIAVAVLDGEVIGKGTRIRHWADRISPLAADQRRWFFGPIGYVLRDVRALPTPVPCRGWQGFWTLPPDVAARVEEQLR